MQPNVVIAYDGFGDILVEQDILRSTGARIEHVGNLDTAHALDAARQADALMVTVQQVSAGLIASMERCQIISRAGTGLDAIDIPAATERGIWVASVPDYSVDEVSSHAIALLLAHARGIIGMVEGTRAGRWDYRVVAPLRRLAGQTLGLLGCGRIGRAVATKARGLGMAVIAYDPYVDAEAIRSSGIQPVEWETLLQTADYISLHVPLTDKTRRILNAEALALMQPTAVLINTARGGLIDEDALLAALQSKQIAAAALDVLSVEPPAPEHPLLREPRVFITPHAAWYSEDANHEVRVRATEEVVRVLRGDRPRCPVNQLDGHSQHRS